jgi:AcrR family transcriptional regulator
MTALEERVPDEITSPSQEMILDAAKHLIMQSGYDGFSMRQLSEESGFAKGTIYHYFRDKQELYLRVIEREMLHSNRVLQSAVDAGIPPQEQLRSAVTCYLQLAEERHYSMFLLLREAGQIEEELKSLIQRHRLSILQPFQQILNQGIAEGVFRQLETEDTVWMLLGMMNGIITVRMCTDAKPPDTRLVETMIDLFCNGICTTQD